MYNQVEGELAYSEGRFLSEQRYNNGVLAAETKNFNVRTDLNEANQLIELSTQNISQVLESLTPMQFEECNNMLFSKIEEMKKQIASLTEVIQLFRKKGDEAYQNSNYEEERKCNSIVMECDTELKKIEHALPYYISFQNDLNLKVDNGRSK